MERSLSKFECMHNKTRNRLSANRTGKLTYLSYRSIGAMSFYNTYIRYAKTNISCCKNVLRTTGMILIDHLIYASLFPVVSFTCFSCIFYFFNLWTSQFPICFFFFFFGTTSVADQGLPVGTTGLGFQWHMDYHPPFREDSQHYVWDPTMTSMLLNRASRRLYHTTVLLGFNYRVFWVNYHCQQLEFGSSLWCVENHL